MMDILYRRGDTMMIKEERSQVFDILSNVPDDDMPSVMEAIVKHLQNNGIEVITTNEHGEKEVIPSQQDILDIKRAKDQIRNGEVYSFDEIFGDE